MRSSFVALVVAATTASTLALPAAMTPTPVLPTESSGAGAPGSAPSSLHLGHGPVVIPSGSGGAKGPRPSGHAGEHPKLWNDKFCTMTGEHKPEKSGEPVGASAGVSLSLRAVPTESGEVEPTGSAGAHPSGKPHRSKLWNDKFCTMTHEHGGPKESGSHVIPHQQEPTDQPTAPSASLKRAEPIEPIETGLSLSGAPLSGATEPTGAASAKGPHHSGKANHSKKPWDPEHCTMSGEHKPEESGHAHSHEPKASGSKRAEPIESSGLTESVASGITSAAGPAHSGKAKHPEHWDDKLCKVKGKGKGGHGHKSGAAGPHASGEASSSLDTPAGPAVTPPPGASGSASLPLESSGPDSSDSALSDDSGADSTAAGATPSSASGLD